MESFMKKQHNLTDFIKMYYMDSNIPIYLFIGEQCIFCMPEQTELTCPPLKYLRQLLSSTGRISYCLTEYGTAFCSLKTEHPKNGLLVFGPVTGVPYADSELRSLYKDYTVPGSLSSEFDIFLKKIPCLSLIPLLKKCIFINYCLHEEIVPLEQLSLSNSVTADDTYIADASLLMEQNYHQKEDEQHNRTYAIEEQILNLVRTGNYEGIKNFEYSESNFHTGITGSTAIRQLKNNIIITATICTRAAIDGGLDYDTAYQLSDYFIKVSEQMVDADHLYNLLSKISYTFAEKVAQAKVPVSSDERIRKAIQYIQQNINLHLTVGDVADYTGFSKSYFTAYFKRILGFSVSAFILRCKLEEGRKLLLYTNKSISTISNFLCFSSQSHFQTAFKKQFGITPSEYRREN